MSDDDTISRRTALKILGVGAAGAPLILESTAAAQHQHTGVQMVATRLDAPNGGPRFFTPAELATITLISELIIPTDEHSPGATEAGVPAFIDMMVSESTTEAKTLWRNGLAAVDARCKKQFGSPFNGCTHEQQVGVLRLISKNEYQPRTVEERFFIAIKGLTVDGYYTSQLGIHQELRYKGNAYLKEFTGCTHPEHTS